MVSAVTGYFFIVEVWLIHTAHKPKVFHVCFLVKTAAFDQKCAEETQCTIENLFGWGILMSAKVEMSCWVKRFTCF
jgi:hypothetical protein